MADDACTHVQEAPGAEPNRTDGCQACLDDGRQDWVELRVCQTCGHVGCCGSSPGEHAAEHFQETGHPVIRPVDGDWVWCYEHEEYD